MADDSWARCLARAVHPRFYALRAKVRREPGPDAWRSIPGMPPGGLPTVIVHLSMRSIGEYRWADGQGWWQAVRGREFITSRSNRPGLNFEADHPPFVGHWFPELLAPLLDRQRDGSFAPRQEIFEDDSDEELIEDCRSGDRHELTFEPDRGLVVEWRAYANGALQFRTIVEELELDGHLDELWPSPEPPQA